MRNVFCKTGNNKCQINLPPLFTLSTIQVYYLNAFLSRYNFTFYETGYGLPCMTLQVFAHMEKNIKKGPFWLCHCFVLFQTTNEIYSMNLIHKSVILVVLLAIFICRNLLLWAYCRRVRTKHSWCCDIYTFFLLKLSSLFKEKYN